MPLESALMGCCKREPRVPSLSATFLAVNNGSLDTCAAGTRGHTACGPKLTQQTAESGCTSPCQRTIPCGKGGNNLTGQIVAGNLRAETLRGRLSRSRTGTRAPNQGAPKVRPRFQLGRARWAAARPFGQGGKSGMAVFGSEILCSGLHPSFTVACPAPNKANTRKIDPTLWENMACGANASGRAVSARMLAPGGGFGPGMAMPAPTVRRRAGRKQARSRARLGRRVEGSACVGGHPWPGGAGRAHVGRSRRLPEVPRGGMRCRPWRARSVASSSQGRRWRPPAAGTRS